MEKKPQKALGAVPAIEISAFDVNAAIFNSFGSGFGAEVSGFSSLPWDGHAKNPTPFLPVRYTSGAGRKHTHRSWATGTTSNWVTPTATAPAQKNSSSHKTWWKSHPRDDRTRG